MEDEANRLFRRASARYRQTRLGTRIALASLMSAALVTAGGLTALNASGAATPTPTPTATGAMPSATPTPTPSPTPTRPHHCICRTPSTTVLSVSPLVQQRKSPVQLTANVSCASLPTGTVTFRRRDNTVLGTASVTFPTALHTGVAEVTVTTGLPLGKRFLKATYNGNSRCLPSTSALIETRIVAHCGCMSSSPGTPGDEVQVTG
jgi:Bacterial Ig-like domain (group 3)